MLWSASLGSLGSSGLIRDSVSKNKMYSTMRITCEVDLWPPTSTYVYMNLHTYVHTYMHHTHEQYTCTHAHYTHRLVHTHTQRLNTPLTLLWLSAPCCYQPNPNQGWPSLPSIGLATRACKRPPFSTHLGMNTALLGSFLRTLLRVKDKLAFHLLCP